MSYDYLRLNISKENPKTLEAAIELAMEEQNLRKKLTLRNIDTDFMSEVSFTCNTTPPFLAQTSNQAPNTLRYEQPMEIDQYRGVQMLQV
jgi:hypothetical protein